MTRIEKAISEQLGLEKDSYKDVQDFYLDILSEISQEGEGFFDTLAEDLQQAAREWYDANVEFASDGEELMPFEQTDEVPFDEEQGTQDENNEIDAEEIDFDGSQEGDLVVVAVEGDDEITGTIEKKMKVALKVTDDQGETVRISKNKITSIHKIAIEEDQEDEKPTPKAKEDAKEEVPVTKEEKAQTAKKSDDVEKSTAKAETGQVTSEEDSVQTLPKATHTCKCKGSDSDHKEAAKQILFHVSEVLRLTSEII